MKRGKIVRMITAISGISFKSSTQQINSKNNLRLNFLQKDTVELKQKTNPSFGSVIPKTKIFKACDSLLESAENLSDTDDATLIVKDFYTKKLAKLLIIDPKMNEKEKYIFGMFSHELKNIVQRNVDASKQELKSFSQNIKQCTEDWECMEKNEKQSDKIVQFKTVFDKLKKTLKYMNSPKVDFVGFEVLKNKKVKNQNQFINLVSQPLLNAVKYGEKKPFKVVFDEVEKDGKKTYYASFINPETKPIPDKEIDKILEGKFYRATSAIESGIMGTGFGFWNMVRVLKENGYEKDIPNLIEKGREKGVCVRVPLIGIQ